MDIKILKVFGKPNPTEVSIAFLVWDNWNDHAFRTLFWLKYVDENSLIHDIGTVKIGFFGQKERETKLNIGDTFQKLDDSFFSLGQSDSYYTNLNNLGSSVRDSILIGLNDIAKDSDIYDKAIGENVTNTSLFRTVSPISVTGQFRRLSSGGVRLTNFNFKFKTPANQPISSFELSFNVNPKSSLSTNTHVIIGRNGVGKTHLINNMIQTLISDKSVSNQYGEFHSELVEDSSKLFANLISISFSAFDAAEPNQEMDSSIRMPYSYIGLKHINKEGETTYKTKDTEMLNQEFIKSLATCIRNSKTTEWVSSIEMLQSDPNFEEANITSLTSESPDEFHQKAFDIFDRLSSGHKIVLLTITRLIESLQERSLVLIDEPEAHLHPPLLSAFIRTLSGLLTSTNGVAIIATHSPVILQEIPKNCAWKIRRTGAEAKAERLEIETFGENVGILTNEIFRLEVTNSGFYKLINDIAQEKETYEQAIDYFDGQLGMEARAILMSIYANKNRQ